MCFVLILSRKWFVVCRIFNVVSYLINCISYISFFCFVVFRNLNGVSFFKILRHVMFRIIVKCQQVFFVFKIIFIFRRSCCLNYLFIHRIVSIISRVLHLLFIYYYFIFILWAQSPNPTQPILAHLAYSRTGPKSGLKYYKPNCHTQFRPFTQLSCEDHESPADRPALLAREASCMGPLLMYVLRSRFDQHHASPARQFVSWLLHSYCVHVQTADSFFPCVASFLVGTPKKQPMLPLAAWRFLQHANSAPTQAPVLVFLLISSCFLLLVPSLCSPASPIIPQ